MSEARGGLVKKQHRKFRISSFFLSMATGGGGRWCQLWSAWRGRERERERGAWLQPHPIPAKPLVGSSRTCERPRTHAKIGTHPPKHLRGGLQAPAAAASLAGSERPWDRHGRHALGGKSWKGRGDWPATVLLRGSRARPEALEQALRAAKAKDPNAIDIHRVRPRPRRRLTVNSRPDALSFSWTELAQ